MTLRTVGVKLLADTTQYISNLKRAGLATKDLAGQMDDAAKAGKLDAVADRAGVAGLALTGLAGIAIKSAADFDKAMSSVRAATHASASDMDALRKAALQAGKDTSFSATEAADGITELSKAGVSTSAILGGGLKGALDLAAAGQLSVGEAAETAASAMTQFKLQGKDVPHIADLLAAGAGKAQGSVHDMGMALSQSGLVASQFGLSVEDSTGTLAAFASAGLTGSDAGTSFKQMLLMLANPAEKTADLMAELGINAYDASGKFVGITNLAEQLKTKLGGLTQAQRDSALAQIFGSDAIRAANVLYQQGGKGIQEWIGKVNDAGYASETAATMTDNLAGDLERLKGSLSTLAIESGSGANSGLRVLVKALDDLVGQFSDLPPAVGSTLTILAGVGGISALALAGFLKLRSGIADAVEQLTAMGPAGEKAAAGLQKATKWAGLATAAFVGLQIVGAVAEKFGNAAANVDSLTSALTNFVNTGKTAGELSEVFGDNLEDLARTAQTADAATHGFWGGLNDLTSSIPGVGSLVDTLNEKINGSSWNQAKEDMAALDQALVNYMQTTNDARKSSELWNKILNESGLGTEQLAAQLPNAYKKLGEMNNAAMGGKSALEGVASGSQAAAGGMKDVAGAAGPATEKTKEYKSAADAAAGAARGEAAALVDLAARMKAEADPVFGFIDAQKNLAKAQRDARSAQKELDKAIEEHGPKSKEAKAATDKLHGATRDLTLASIDLQGKSGALGDSFTGKLTPSMRETLKAAGLTEKQIRDVEKQFKDAKIAADKYDDKYEAKTSAPGAKEAKAALDKAYTAGKLYDGSYVARVSIDGKKPVDAALDALLVKQRALQTGLSVSAARAAVQKDLDRNRQRGYHDGGRTAMVGEHEPAGIVHGQEFVFDAATVRRIDRQAPGFLDEALATGQLPGYAAGGRVIWPYRADVSKTDIPAWSEVMSKIAGNFGNWPSSPGAQRGDSGVWRKILALVKSSGIPYDFGNAYRPGDPLWHGSGRAIDFMGYNQDRLAQFFLSRQNQVLELIHRTKNRDYGITRGHYNAMPTQWPLHRNHLHIAMKNGGTIAEPVMGVGASGRTYSFGENYQPERVIPNWQGAGGGTQLTVVLENRGVIGSQAEVSQWLTGAVDDLKRKGRI